MKRILIYVGALVILLLGAGVIFLLGTPRLIEISPEDAALDVSAGSTLRLTFSRKMQAESVEQRLRLTPDIPGSFSWEGKTLVFQPRQNWPAGTVVQVNLQRGARALGWLSLPTRQDIDWTFTIRQPRLLYLYPSDGAANLYLYDPGTERSTALTNLLSGILEFDATQDGSAVYYSVENNLGGSDIYRLAISSDLSNLQASRVIACQQYKCRAPVVSPGENFLAYERTGPPGSDEPGYPRVWVAQLAVEKDAEGHVTVRQEGDSFLVSDQLHQAIQPDWSPEGMLSFYDTSQQVFVILEPTGTQRTFLPNQTGEPGSWEPGSRHYITPEIYFNVSGNPETVTDLRAVASSRLLRYDIDTTEYQDLTQSENLEDTNPVFSPGGDQLAFARKYLDIVRWTPGRQLWVMNADGSEARQLTNSPDYNSYDMDWEPDGNRLVFVRFNQTNPMDLPVIWMYDLVKNYEVEWIQGGFSPKWIP
jgi:Tol biopolymer transport system component